jgi:hypothetical protein
MEAMRNEETNAVENIQFKLSLAKLLNGTQRTYNKNNSAIFDQVFNGPTIIYFVTTSSEDNAEKERWYELVDYMGFGNQVNPDHIDGKSKNADLYSDEED